MTSPVMQQFGKRNLNRHAMAILEHNNMGTSHHFTDSQR